MATIKSILGMDLEKLEAMSNEELRRYCEPFLRAVVPTPAKKPLIVDVSGEDSDDDTPTPYRAKKKKATSNWQDEANKLMKQLGLTELPKLPPKL